MKAEMAELESKHPAKVINLEDANYASFEEGFDKAITQIKYFNKDVPIDFTLVNRQKILDEILRL